MAVAAPRFEELKIRFETSPGGDSLVVHVLDSPCGACPAQPFAPPALIGGPAAALRSLEGALLGGNGIPDTTRNFTQPLIPPPTPVSPKEIGHQLFESLFRGPLRENLLQCLARIDGRDSAALRVRLVLDESVVDTVGAWPWELLYRAETRDFLARSIRTPVVRQIEVQRSRLTPTEIEHLRILAVISDPTDAGPLQVAREKERIEAAVAGDAGVQIDYLEPPTAEALRRRLRAERYDVLHMVGHGELDPSGEGYFLLEDGHDRVGRISGLLLAEILKGSQLRLVVLNACETARLPAHLEGPDPFLGAATALVMAGMPAVVAMQLPISDRAAIAFSEAFYHSLAAGEPVESAVVDGRLAVSLALPDSWEWATPVLFLGVPNGDLFIRAAPPEVEPAPKAVAGPPAQSAESQVAKALDLLEHLRYQPALQLLLAAADADPDDPAVSFYLALCRLQGKRPRAARLDVVRQIERDLDTALDPAGAATPAHVYYLLALLKHDFYRFKGLAIHPPTVEELLVEAQGAPADPVELRRLLHHVPTPPSPVLVAIEGRLAASVD